LKNKSTQQVNQ